jgi:cysteine desulfurase family protein
VPIYLDNAATSFPKPETVYRAVDHTLREIGVGPARGGHAKGMAATRIVFAARETLAALFGIRDSSRIIMTHSATEALNLAIFGLLKAGDHVVTTSLEHNSVVRPLQILAQRGVEVTWLKGNRDGIVGFRQVAAAMRPSTRLVAISHCSNVNGAIQPMEEIGSLTRNSPALLLVDASQSAGSLPVNVVESNIDLLAVPGHKGMLGPLGTGFLYVAENVQLRPLMYGGTGSSSSDELQPEALPERFESGTLNTPGIAGLKAGADFILATGIDMIRKRESYLVSDLVSQLREFRGVRVFSPHNSDHRGGVVSFIVEGMDPALLGFLLDRDYDISVRVGLHCAPLAHKTLGTFPQGTVRVSPGYFSTESDIEQFLEAMREIIGKV